MSQVYQTWELHLLLLCTLLAAGTAAAGAPAAGACAPAACRLPVVVAALHLAVALADALKVAVLQEGVLLLLAGQEAGKAHEASGLLCAPMQHP